MARTVRQCGKRYDDFLAGLPVAATARVKLHVNRLAKEGNSLRPPLTKPLRDGLFELRTKHGSDIYRNIFIFWEGEIIILESFVKKQQRTPNRHIDAALTRRSEIIMKAISLGHIITN